MSRAAKISAAARNRAPISEETRRKMRDSREAFLKNTVPV